VAGSLFDRLTRGAAGVRMDDDESIRVHLLRMLLTRQGAVQALPDYGLPDLNDLSLSRAEIIHQCCSSIAACIRKYEPRLQDVKVRHVELDESRFTMAFFIEAVRMRPDGGLVPWSWSVVVDGVQVRGKS